MPERPPLSSDYVVLTEEPNLMRAHLVAGALDEAGIPTFTDQDNLADEFALSQKLMGLLRVRVLVPRERIDEARAIFLAMSQPIPLVDEDEDDEEKHEEGEGDLDHERARFTVRSALFAIVLAILVPCAVVLLVKGCAGANDDAPSRSERGRPEPPPKPPPPPVLHR